MFVTVKIGDIKFRVEIEDLNQRPVIARIGEQTFEVWPEPDSSPAQAEPPQARKLTPETGLQTNHKDRVILAPLPGTVSKVHVQPGSQVAAGDTLLVIDAMKMKNAIRTSRDGQVIAVHVSAGQTVKHRQLLVEFAG